MFSALNGICVTAADFFFLKYLYLFWLMGWQKVSPVIFHWKNDLEDFFYIKCIYPYFE